MISSYTRLLLLLGSALVGQTFAAAAPWEDEIEQAMLEIRDMVDKSLEIRAEQNWTPPGAPPIKDDQNLGAYLANILEGEGEPENEPQPKKPKRKRQNQSQLQIPKAEYVQGNFNTSTRWEENGETYEIMMVDNRCPSGIKPHHIAGDIITPDGIDWKNATAADIVSLLWDVRVAHKTDIDAREAAYAEFFHNQTAALEREVYEVMDHGWICPAAPGSNIVLHDELRRKLFADVSRRRLLELNKWQYYLALLSASVISGAIIAGIQAGITHATSEVELGTEAWLNSAVGNMLIIFLATDFSRWAPRIQSAAAASPVFWVAWGRRQIAKTVQALKRSQSSAAGLMAGGVTAAGGGATGPGGNPCVTPEEAAAAAANMMEQGQASGPGGMSAAGSSNSGGIPEGAVNAAGQAANAAGEAVRQASGALRRAASQYFDYASDDDTANVISAAAKGECRRK